MAVSIIDLSGTLNHSQSIIITGSGFGTKSPAAPDLWDTVDNIAVYSALNDGDTIPVGAAGDGYPFAQNGYFDPNIMKYETSDSQRTTLSSACYKALNSDAGFFNGRTVAGATQIYIAWWTKFNQEISGSTHSSKYLRLNGGSSPDGANQTFSLTQMNSYGYDNAYCGPGGTISWNGVTCLANTWHFIEVWANQNTKQFSVWKDGSILEDQFAQTDCGVWNYDYVWRLGFDGGGVSPPSPTLWMDDVYVDKTPARVMIAEGNTWNTRGHSEMQVPSAWATGEITFTVNRGSFGAAETAYLYVVDSDGTVNADGYAIQFGQTYGGSASVSPKGSSSSEPYRVGPINRFQNLRKIHTRY